MSLMPLKVGKQAARLDLVFEQGSHFSLHFTRWSLYYGYQDIRNVPYDFTGFGARMMIRRKLTDEEPLFSSDTEDDGMIVLGDDLGTVQIDIPHTITIGFTWRDKASWDLEVVDTLDRPWRLLEGRAEVSREVTQP